MFPVHHFEKGETRSCTLHGSWKLPRRSVSIGHVLLTIQEEAARVIEETLWSDRRLAHMRSQGRDRANSMRGRVLCPQRSTHASDE